MEDAHQTGRRRSRWRTLVPFVLTFAVGFVTLLASLLPDIGAIGTRTNLPESVVTLLIVAVAVLAAIGVVAAGWSSVERSRDGDDD